MLLLVLTTAGGAYVVIRREIICRFQAENYAHEQREWCMTTLTVITHGLDPSRKGRTGVPINLTRVWKTSSPLCLAVAITV